MRIGIVAGEASGDALGADLIRGLRARDPDLQIEGIGGPLMIAAGCKSLFDIKRLSVMGLIEPLLRLPDLIKLRRDISQHFLNHPPDIFIGIDAPDFNLGLELKLHRAGIRVIHYVSPSVWAWRPGRIKKIAKAVDLMLTLLPFEAAFYQQHHVPVHYVGHPLAKQVPLAIDTGAARRALCLDEEAVYVALLPGSRLQEIRHIGEPMMKAARLAWQQKPHLRFLTAHVDEACYQAFYDCHQQHAPDLPLTFFTRRAPDVLAASDAVLVTSGTATLETMLYKKPMVIIYRMARPVFAIVKRLVKTPYVGLPNLLANELIVPELIQDNATAEKISEALLHYLDHPELAVALATKFSEMHHLLLAEGEMTAADAVVGEIC